VLEGSGNPTRLAVSAVSASFFDTLGTPPIRGRVLTAGDDVPNAARVVVFAHGTWVDRFGADAAIVGRSIRLDGQPHTIVGVMPADFDFPRGADLWTPAVPIIVESSARWQTDGLENVGVLYVLGRLRPGVTLSAARDELDASQRRSIGEPSVGGRLVVLTPLLDHLLGLLREGLWLLLAAVGVLLLIACANVSGLALTRAVARRREQAIRIALGASRTRLASQALVETLILAVVGGAAGLLLSMWLIRAMRSLAPGDLPRITEVAVNLPVAIFTCAVVMLTALLCVIGPLVQTNATRVTEVLSDAARATSGRMSLRARSALVVVQISLAVMLLIAASLVARSFVRLGQVDIGFDPVNVLTMAIEPLAVTGPVNDWFAALIERVEALPDVTAAGAIFLRPLALGAIGNDTTVIAEGQPDTIETAQANPLVNRQVATPGYFRAMHTPLVGGRLFDDRDRRGAPRVVVIGERAAQRLFPGQDPIGKRLCRTSTAPVQESSGTRSSAW
jgi:predicted permease